MPINKTVYRYVFEDLSNPNIYLPPLIINPNRVDLDSCQAKCDAYALSLFNDLQKAEKQLSKFLNRKPHLAEVFGTCIGKLDITSEDGEADKEDKISHFNFHEYNHSRKYHIEIIKTIKID